MQELDKSLIVGRLSTQDQHAVVREQIAQLRDGLTGDTGDGEIGHIGADRIQDRDSHLSTP